MGPAALWRTCRLRGMAVLLSSGTSSSKCGRISRHSCRCSFPRQRQAASAAVLLWQLQLLQVAAKAMQQLGWAVSSLMLLRVATLVMTVTMIMARQRTVPAASATRCTCQTQSDLTS